MDGDLIGLQGAGPSSAFERLAHNPTDPDVAWANVRTTGGASKKVFLIAVGAVLTWISGIAIVIFS